MSSGERQAASRIAVVLGTALGLFYLLLVAPVTFFTAGKNVSSLELAATALLLQSTLPVSFLVAYHRRPAGIWLTLAALCSAAAGCWNTYSLLRNIPWRFGEVFGSAFPRYAGCSHRTLFWITGVLGWPNLRMRTTVSTRTE
jgi:hypothetical protein